MLPAFTTLCPTQTLGLLYLHIHGVIKLFVIRDAELAMCSGCHKVDTFVVGFDHLWVFFLFKNMNSCIPLRPILNKKCLKFHYSLGDFFQLFPFYAMGSQVRFCKHWQIFQCLLEKLH